MRIMLVLDHPYTLAGAVNTPHQRGFTPAVTAAAIRGVEASDGVVDLVDLSKDDFNPAMGREDLLAWRGYGEPDSQVRDYQTRLLAADHLVFAFPIYWEAMPAATKGFIDKVIAQNVLYREEAHARGNPFRSLMPQLQGVTALTVMSTPHAAYRWWFGNPVTKILFKGTFGKIGIKNLTWRNYPSIETRSPDEREKMLTETERYFALLSNASPVNESNRG